MWRWGSDWLWDGRNPPSCCSTATPASEVDPLVVDELTGEPLDVRRLRIVRNRDAAPPATDPAV